MCERSSISFQYHHGRSRYQFVYNEHMAANNRKDVNYPRMQRAAIRKVVHGEREGNKLCLQKCLDQSTAEFIECSS